MQCKNEITLGWNVYFDYELIADNGKCTRTKKNLNEDLSHVNNVFPNVALSLLQQSTPTYLNYKVFYGNVDNPEEDVSLFIFRRSAFVCFIMHTH